MLPPIPSYRAWRHRKQQLNAPSADCTQALVDQLPPFLLLACYRELDSTSGISTELLKFARKGREAATEIGWEKATEKNY